MAKRRKKEVDTSTTDLAVTVPLATTRLDFDALSAVAKAAGNVSGVLNTLAASGEGYTAIQQMIATMTERNFGFINSTEALSKINAGIAEKIAAIAEAATPTTYMLENMREIIGNLSIANNLNLQGLEDLYKTQNCVTDIAIQDIKRESETETRHTQFEERVLAQLTEISERLDRLEGKQPQPHPRLEALQKEVAEHDKFLTRNKDTIEDLTLLNETNRRQFIQELGNKKEGSHDGR